jgi:hypothetical protein
LFSCFSPLHQHWEHLYLQKFPEYFTFSYIHGWWLFILWFHCGFCNKKLTFRGFTEFLLKKYKKKPKKTSLYLQKFPFFFLRSETNLHFPHPAFWRSGCRLSNSTVIYIVDDYSFFGSTVDFVIKNEHLGVLPDLAFSKCQRRRVEIWP